MVPSATEAEAERQGASIELAEWLLLDGMVASRVCDWKI